MLDLKRISGILIALLVNLCLVTVALADGSRTLYPSGATGSRANLEWTNQFYGPANLIARRTIINVYARAGEVLLMGSSAVGVTGFNGQQGNILVYSDAQITGPIGGETVPAPASAEFNCNNQRGSSGLPTQGQILSRTAELAGPDTIPTGTIANAYVPCFYTVPTDGIYHVVFLGPSGFSASGGVPTGQISLASANNFGPQQGPTVAAWDITVRSSLTSTTDIEGRVFAYYYSLFTGGNGRPVNFDVYVVTLDGYVYETNMRGLDPNGWVLYGNQLGFLDTDGSPLYRDVIGTTGGANMSTLAGGVSMQRPQFPVFLSADPEDDLLNNLGIPITPVLPVLSDLSFSGTLSGTTSIFGTGGDFRFESNIDGVYEVIVSRDGVDFDPTNPNNRVLRGTMNAGIVNVAWDGLDNSGLPFPVGAGYRTQVTIRGGEYHFPIIDAENSINGGPGYNLINPPGGICPPFTAGCRVGFYDDRGYVTRSGAPVGTLNVLLCGNNPPSTASDISDGFDTQGSQRAFGAATGGNTNESCLDPMANVGAFGDLKGLDLWTYYPSNIEIVELQIVDPPTPTPSPTPKPATSDTVDPALEMADPFITKSVNPPFAIPGEQVTWTISIGNPGVIAVNNVSITDVLPSEVEIQSVTATRGNASFSGQAVTVVVGQLAPGESVTVQVFTQVRDNVVMPFAVTNQACANFDGGQVCAKANLLSVRQLPATGQSPWSLVRAYVLMYSALALIGGILRGLLWRVAHPSSSSAKHRE